MKSKEERKTEAWKEYEAIAEPILKKCWATIEPVWNKLQKKLRSIENEE